MMPKSAGNDRLKAAGVALLAQALLIWALITGLHVDLPRLRDETPTVFAIGPTPPPKQAMGITSRRSATHRPAGVAAPPALKSVPTELVAPPVIPFAPPPPMIAVPDPGAGTIPTIGNAERPASGTCTGDEGNGSGSGGAGEGDGGAWTPPRLMKALTAGDYPAPARAAHAQGIVTIRYRVGTDGRVTQCRMVRGSGSPVLDEATCPIAEQRLRYRPARDERGAAIVTTVTREQRWFTGDPDPDRR